MPQDCRNLLDTRKVNAEQKEEMTMDMEQPENRASCRPATSSNPHDQATLLSLPREMRNEIYAYLLASGHLAILRSSRQLSVEALELIYTKAIFRVFVNSRQACHNYQPGVKVAEKIQNLQLDWHLSDFICQRNANEVIDFCQKQQQMLKTCHVILRFGTWQAALLTANDITALRNLRVLRQVVLETMIVGSTQPTPKWHLAQIQSRVHPAQIQSRVLSIFQQAKWSIATSFGTRRANWRCRCTMSGLSSY